MSTTGDLYRNRRIGLEVLKPPGWEFSSIADFAAVREQTLLLDEVRGEQFPEELHPLKDVTNLPVFLFENPRWRHGSFVPGIAMYDEPLDGAAPRHERRAHARMIAGLAQSYADCRVLEAPAYVELRGAKATWCRWSYLHEIASGQQAALDVQSLLVFRAPRVHTWYLIDRHPDHHVADATWRKVIDSIGYDGRQGDTSASS
ncbi:hypothetical protein [Luteimonas sp. 3794]|uniref:hypothetical protein n=1 Tax=Luteimonas sp. 3794 TaxID=2817730 RepID=UPI002863E3B4|nr:hypothetical protein [Luteimonas sp. 3794]MDR6992904.1 hypothetical protein [Luteimonas sp. 3794]